MPVSHTATALHHLGATGCAIIAMRNRTIAAPLMAYEIGARPSRDADDFISDVSRGLPLRMDDHE